MFLYSLWLQLPLPTRHKIAGEFNIAKKGPTHVDSNRIVSDGYDIKDVEAALDKEAIQKFLNTDEEDLEVLWGRLVDRAEGKTNTILVPVVLESVAKDIIKEKNLDIEVNPSFVPTPLPKPKRGRPKKK